MPIEETKPEEAEESVAPEAPASTMPPPAPVASAASEPEEPEEHRGKSPIEHWVKETKTSATWVVALKERHGWGAGKYLTEKEFTDALASVKNITLS